MENQKPLVAIACLCQIALQDKDNVLSLVRIVDTFYVRKRPEDLPESIAAGIEFTVVVTLKSGAVSGKSEVAMSVRMPSGAVKELVPPQPMLLKGDEHGINLIAQVVLQAQEIGLYWCDVIWQSETLTSIPFRLKLKEDDANEESSN